MSLDRSARARMVRLAADGFSYGEIGEIYGISRSVVAGIIYRMRQAENERRQSPLVARRPRTSHIYRDLQPAKYPYAPDDSCPEFANDDDHCAAVMAGGGYPQLPIQTRGRPA